YCRPPTQRMSARRNRNPTWGVHVYVIRSAPLRRLVVAGLIALVVPLAWWLVDRAPDDTWPAEDDTTVTDGALTPTNGAGRAPGPRGETWTPRSARVVMGGDLL